MSAKLLFSIWHFSSAIVLLSFLLGLKAWLSGDEQRFQSSIDHTRALSLWRLGVAYLHRYRQEEESVSLINTELALRQEVHQQT